MPSPFPGMDPFIEGHIWRDFHVSIIIAIRDLLVPVIRPRYFVRTEERVYLDYDMDDGRSRHIIPDLLIGEPRTQTAYSGAGGGVSTITVQPVNITLPMPEEVKQRYLVIRDSASQRIVTVIEVLSPANKRAGGADRALYLAKRDEVLMGGANLVELDLLRGGRRLPSQEPLPPADFYAIVCRASERPRASAFPWTLRQPLPTIPIPLADGDPDVPLALQAALTTLYDRAGYDYSLNYSGDVDPPLPDADLTWCQDILRSQGSPT
jgi:hypothetical protein